MPWYEPKDPTPCEQCPCCGYISLPERGMSLICCVCLWEDDAFIGNELDEYSVCNKMTLRQARANFIAFGACDAEMLMHVLPVHDRGRFRYEPLSPPEADA
ncbi:CPCC family cysteine-rich protein [Polyangium mundeleinium]|uniref:CPCC family cysteine-rich protein n=1 Tax=Polyangium mundeleinium TaxID=2995306 RepID=A0ABT5F3G0_9BACT|nr:CPCC family cysteine-rich protein [Polyangium mundeleinium]MDC0748625.1 CPCC family cysteine-rich protein [Polyangium mundeleinium]